eukprot:15073381-Ditylum_brightwellii.AAC.1
METMMLGIYKEVTSLVHYRNNGADDENKDDADIGDCVAPVENRLSCRWPVVLGGGQIVNIDIFRA